MGVDSVTIAHRWLTDPATRDFALDRLVVTSAMTGEEFEDTRAAMEGHLLPLFRQHGVRYVQLARNGHEARDGITVLSDTRTPDRLHAEGVYRLSQELKVNGTVPQVGSRRCSIKYKGWVIDTWLAREFRGRPFRQVMGFNADEEGRVERDRCYGGDNRTAEYPLLAWGMGRAACEAYLLRAFGFPWPKSCCVVCPFTRGKEGVLERYARLPEQAADALYLEHLSLALNPNMTLYAHGSLRDALAADRANDHSPAFALLNDRLNAAAWAVYRVRRIYHAKGRADRKVEKLARGTRRKATAALARLAAEHGQGVQHTAGSPRFWTKLRLPDRYPTVEEMFVAAPADAADKCRGRFDGSWDRVTLRSTNH
jgi:hypothetical protein